MRLTNQHGLTIPDLQYFVNFKQKIYIGHKKIPTALHWNPQGNRLISCDTNIRLWVFDDHLGLQKLTQLKGHDNTVEAAQFGSKDLFATLSKQSVKFWDIREGNNLVKPLKNEKKHKSDFTSLCWNSNSASFPLIAISNKENVVNIHDFRNFSIPLFSLKPNMEIGDFSWDKSDSILFIAGGQTNLGFLTMYLASNYQPIPQNLNLHCSKINSIAFDPRNYHMATASEDSLLQILNIPQLICERTYSNKSDSAFKKISFCHNGSYIAASSEEPYIDIYNVEKGGHSFRIKCSNEQENVVWHPTKMILAYTEGEDKKKMSDRNSEECSVRLFMP